MTRRNGKIGRLVAKQQQYRQRRFKRNIPPEAEQSAPPSTVINLSSSTLSDSEHSLLSKGLNFCPTPPTASIREEREALKTLRARKDIIIKPADKGSAAVVMGRQQYIDEAMRQLNNQTNYKPLDTDPTGIQNQVPNTAIIGTFDVSSLYTNIPQDEGIAACSSALAKSSHDSPPISDIVSLMNHVLTKNNFSFMGKNFLQVHGTAMGTRMAPSMACLFMSQLEQRMLASAPCRPWVWWRYIDDIFFIWTSDGSSLTAFINHINSFHRTIKFTTEYSTKDTHFLDVKVLKTDDGLITDLLVKPPDKHQYLHSTSCHPRHCKTSIAYSQALRLRRICSKDSDFIHHSQELKKHLVSRGHSSLAVHRAIQKVKARSRESVLSKRPV
ncbi:uncharacterized protein LOC119743326 [Patiria miniata]|uniref:Reverse transcriptase domain-containing protein n=1 Tax=Patiria miniata TaxID=46514 RepID=A0A914BJN2_PATMI|nr:uncharacterized protein LOC119743326 [Patiria miniata]